MNVPSLLVLILIPLVLWADEPPPLSLFALPRIELRSAPSSTVAPTNQPASTETSTNSTTDLPAEDFSLTREREAILIEAGIQSFESMNGISLLSAPEPSYELGGAAGWLNENVWDPVFAPEVIKVGKVRMTGGIVAAIKRKNPFCLLHPLVFAAGW
jgi:hypothetical protein